MTFKREVKGSWHQALREWDFLLHETKRRVLVKFLVVLAILASYTLFVSIHFGVKEGFIVSLLTWSFFVFCTPVADAGIIIDFPLRLVLRIRMFTAETIVWLVATTINALALFLQPSVYNQTIILNLFHHIISHPWPFSLIILLSAAGTFLSVRFADELVDVAEEKARHLHHKHHLLLKGIILAFLFFFVFILYDYLLVKFGVQIPLL